MIIDALAEGVGMDAKVDYLSFTVPLNLSGVGHGEDVEAHIIHALGSLGLTGLLERLQTWTGAPRGGRGHYGAGIYWEALHASVWWGGISNHVLVELAGVACQVLRDHDKLLETIDAVQTRATRIDVAVDLPEAGKPSDFVSKMKAGRFKARASLESVTGWTEYVGAMKSDRFARVYLYAEPHPRAGVLRVEHVLRDDYAKRAAADIAAGGLAEVVAKLGNSFGWEHPRWKPEIVTDGKLRAQRHDSHGAGTLRWLATAVAPALVKAQRDGLIDVEEWLREYVLDVLRGNASE